MERERQIEREMERAVLQEGGWMLDVGCWTMLHCYDFGGGIYDLQAVVHFVTQRYM